MLGEHPPDVCYICLWESSSAVVYFRVSESLEVWDLSDLSVLVFCGFFCFPSLMTDGSQDHGPYKA